jgi:hypothetical protein
MRQHHFLPVFLALIASYIGLHFYAARWLARSFSLGHSAASWLRLALLLAAFLSPFTMYLRRNYHSPALEVYYNAGYAWMGVILVAAFVFFCSDLAAALLRRAPAGRLAANLPPAALATLAAVLAFSFYNALKTPAIKETIVAVKDLPPGLEGFKIAQISDTHIDSAWKLRQFGGIVGSVNRAKPDLVLITGDLIDPGLTCREGMRDLTLLIKSRLGLFGSLGNHEYYYGLDKAADCYKAFGIKLLKNEAADLKDLRLIGLGDIHTENLSGRDVVRLLEKHKSPKFTIILSHQPLYYELIAGTGKYLALSGHTHRGQIFPFSVFTRLVYKYFYGLYRIKDSAFYVTSGAGTWGPPMRWLAPAEIPLLILRKE